MPNCTTLAYLVYLSWNYSSTEGPEKATGVASALDYCLHFVEFLSPIWHIYGILKGHLSKVQLPVPSNVKDMYFPTVFLLPNFVSYFELFSTWERTGHCPLIYAWTSYVPWSVTLHIHTVDHPVFIEILYQSPTSIWQGSWLSFAGCWDIWVCPAVRLLMQLPGPVPMENWPSSSHWCFCISALCCLVLTHILIHRRVLLQYSISAFVNNIVLSKSI